MDTVGTVKIEFWAVVLGATDAILNLEMPYGCLLYTSPSPRDAHESRMPSSA